MKYIIANWKANKTYEQAVEWMNVFASKIQTNDPVNAQLQNNAVTIIICPPYPFIIPLKQLLPNLPNLYLGSQDVSFLPDGSHTGEVTASMLKDYVDFTIVGHSERRTEEDETESIIEKKLQQLQSYNIRSILCIRNERDTIYDSASVVVYEPVESIGTGNNASVDEVVAMKKKIQLRTNQPFLYGGSVNNVNCKNYLQNNEIDGILPGKASLDVETFFSMITQIQ